MLKKIFKKIKLSVFKSQTIVAFSVGGMMGDWDWNNMMGFGWGGGIIMLIFWIIVIWAGFMFFRWIAENVKGNASASNKALDILKEKYAKGEITKEEFETKKKDLM